MSTHVNRHCLQNNETTEHYADTMEQAGQFLIDLHQSDCQCDEEGGCLMDFCRLNNMTVEEIAEYGQWELEEAECGEDCPEKN